MTIDPADRVNDMFAEWDTADTVAAVGNALGERYDVTMIEADEEAYEKLRKIRPFFAFNIAEGLYGPSREGQIPSLLEMLRIPYLGSDPLTLGICLVKSRAKEVLAYYGVPTAPHSVVASADDLRSVPLRFPSIVKPLHEGSSKGIYDSCVVRSAEELRREVEVVLATYGEPALVEEFLPGREFTVAMLGNGEGLRLLPVVEIKFDALPAGANPIYSYEAKWIWDTVEEPLDIYECPAPLDERLRRDIESLCRKTYNVLRCRDWTRIDLRCDEAGEPPPRDPAQARGQFLLPQGGTGGGDDVQRTYQFRARYRDEAVRHPRPGPAAHGARVTPRMSSRPYARAFCP